VFLCLGRILEKTGIQESQGNSTINRFHRAPITHTYIYTACPIIYNHFPHRLGGLEDGLLGSWCSWRSPSAGPCFANRRSWQLVEANRWAKADVTPARRLAVSHRPAVGRHQTPGSSLSPFFRSPACHRRRLIKLFSHSLAHPKKQPVKRLIGRCCGRPARSSQVSREDPNRAGHVYVCRPLCPASGHHAM